VRQQSTQHLEEVGQFLSHANPPSATIKCVIFHTCLCFLHALRFGFDAFDQCVVLQMVDGLMPLTDGREPDGRAQMVESQMVERQMVERQMVERRW